MEIRDTYQARSAGWPSRRDSLDSLDRMRALRRQTDLKAEQPVTAFATAAMLAREQQIPMVTTKLVLEAPQEAVHQVDMKA